MRPGEPPLPAPLARSRAIAVAVMTATAAVAAGLLSSRAGLAFGAGLGAMLVTFLLWNPMVVGRDDVSLGGAAALGLLVVVAAYPVMLAIGLPAAALVDGVPFEPSGPNATRLGDALYFIAFGVTYGTFFGLALTGWVTVPLGIAAAMGVAWWTRRALRRGAAATTVVRT